MQRSRRAHGSQSEKAVAQLDGQQRSLVDSVWWARCLSSPGRDLTNRRGDALALQE